MLADPNKKSANLEPTARAAQGARIKGRHGQVEGDRGGAVHVRAAARLHMGFLDLDAAFGRRFGSVGLAVDAPMVRLTARRASALQARGAQAERARRYAERFLQDIDAEAGVEIEVHEAIPPHIGLGSGTQLAMAVGSAIAHLLRPRELAADIAARHERGQRSGIGLAAFERGGFVLDGGKGSDEEPPPVIARLEFPGAWRVLLIIDEALSGLHGEREQHAFAALPPWRAEMSARLCHDMLLRVLPALALGNAREFGLGIAALQRTVGDHFAAVQGGRFVSARVADVLQWLERSGITGVGQSSWGPTGFAIVESAERAEQLVHEAQARWAKEAALRFMVVSGRNRGAEVEILSNGISLAP